jgi:hypothetical protein
LFKPEDLKPHQLRPIDKQRQGILDGDTIAYKYQPSAPQFENPAYDDNTKL